MLTASLLLEVQRECIATQRPQRAITAEEATHCYVKTAVQCRKHVPCLAPVALLLDVSALTRTSYTSRTHYNSHTQYNGQ
jgi:hypothetical protein